MHCFALLTHLCFCKLLYWSALKKVVRSAKTLLSHTRAWHIFLLVQVHDKSTCIWHIVTSSNEVMFTVEFIYLFSHFLVSLFAGLQKNNWNGFHRMW